MTGVIGALAGPPGVDLRRPSTHGHEDVVFCTVPPPAHGGARPRARGARKPASSPLMPRRERSWRRPPHRERNVRTPHRVREARLRLDVAHALAGPVGEPPPSWWGHGKLSEQSTSGT